MQQLVSSLSFASVNVSKTFSSSSEYRTEDCARIVLDKLEKIGYRVLSMTGIGQTCIWLLHKELVT